ncbi:MAG: N-acetylneuraminate synthase family protein [Kiritimatiellae bacterium]|nr:N-acetylneuraminate synthase family protein [Kiritimatiellia bacterium]MDD4735032.1 N-acetylneuraminate synthase family protein [Kiritimatiellia bacterium]
MQIGNKTIGTGNPCYVIAEIGINHNGSLETAKKLIDVACVAGCDAVKFQKRNPDVCVPEEQKSRMRETPWGYISYLEYRWKMEFGVEDYQKIERYCAEKKIDWFVSCWDIPSVELMEEHFNLMAYKVPSACITDMDLLDRYKQTGRPLIVSTGMSSVEQIEAAVQRLAGTADRLVGKEEEGQADAWRSRVALTHCTSTYPCPVGELNLNVIQTLQKKYNVPVGYSGHEVGLQATLAAVTLGACLVERHITLDRAMWGTDQAASVEPSGLIRLVRDIRIIQEALGDGVKKVFDSEKAVAAKLRRLN